LGPLAIPYTFQDKLFYLCKKGSWHFDWYCIQYVITLVEYYHLNSILATAALYIF
jgi:hypothetical protein